MRLQEICEGAISDVHVTTVGQIDFFVARFDYMKAHDTHAATKAKERGVSFLLDKNDPQAKQWYAAAAKGLIASATEPAKKEYLIYVEALKQGAIVEYSPVTKNARIITILPVGHSSARPGTPLIKC